MESVEVRDRQERLAALWVGLYNLALRSGGRYDPELDEWVWDGGTEADRGPAGEVEHGERVRGGIGSLPVSVCSER